MASCKNPKSPEKASPGMLMMVSVLVSAATMESEIAHHGMVRSARK